jgi:hypothetical protein
MKIRTYGYAYAVHITLAAAIGLAIWNWSRLYDEIGLEVIIVWLAVFLIISYLMWPTLRDEIDRLKYSNPANPGRRNSTGRVGLLLLKLVAAALAGGLLFFVLARLPALEDGMALSSTSDLYLGISLGFLIVGLFLGVILLRRLPWVCVLAVGAIALGLPALFA